MARTGATETRAMPVTNLTLVVPELLRETSVRLPALERLLARSDPLPCAVAEGGVVPLLFQIFGIASDPLPIAAVTRAFDSQDPTPGWWLRADPVHLQINQATVRLFDQRVLRLAANEAERLAAEVSATDHPPPSSQQDFRLEALHPTRWYLPLATPAHIQTSRLATVHGQDIRHYLPEGKDGKAWQRWLNHCQILLHNSPVNAEREARGEAPINSVWLWGEGETPNVIKGTFSHVWSDEPLALGLALLAKTPYDAQPENAEDWLYQTSRRSTGKDLVVLQDLLDLSEAAPSINPAEDWQSALNRLEQTWFAPLLAALQTETLASLTLYPCPAPPRTITGTQLRRRWWRRGRALGGYVVKVAL